MLYAVIALSVVLVLVVWTGVRERAAMMFSFAVEREQWMLERRELLNRIEPATAQYGPARQEMPDLSIPFDDDEEYARIANMTREELAELADN